MIFDENIYFAERFRYAPESTQNLSIMNNFP